jgi:hypothetical protein
MTPKELIENYERTVKELHDLPLYEVKKIVDKLSELLKCSRLLGEDIEKNGPIIIVDTIYLVDGKRLVCQSLKKVRNIE